MITGYRIYRTDGRAEMGWIDWPANPTLDQIKIFVEPIVGGDMEHVLVLDPAKVEADEVGRGDYRDMFVDGNGHPRGRERNDVATHVYRANWLRAEGGDPEDLSWIAGDAVLFERRVWS